MQHGLYAITPEIVDAMKEKKSFMVIFEGFEQGNVRGRLVWDISGWNEVHGLGNFPRRMLAHHINAKNASGYVLKDTGVATDLTVPDDIIQQGYDVIVKSISEIGGNMCHNVA